jgi:hypothetical protein
MDVNLKVLGIFRYIFKDKNNRSIHNEIDKYETEINFFYTNLGTTPSTNEKELNALGEVALNTFSLLKEKIRRNNSIIVLLISSKNIYFNDKLLKVTLMK